MILSSQDPVVIRFAIGKFELRVDENPVELRVDVKQLESVANGMQHAIFGCFQK